MLPRTSARTGRKRNGRYGEESGPSAIGKAGGDSRHWAAATFPEKDRTSGKGGLSGLDWLIQAAKYRTLTFIQSTCRSNQDWTNVIGSSTCSLIGMSGCKPTLSIGSSGNRIDRLVAHRRTKSLDGDGASKTFE